MIGRSWKEDREAFIKLAFSLEFSRSSGIEKEDTHNKFFEVFKAVPVTMVTTFQGHKEWHLAHCFGMTSTTTHTLIKALLRHYFALSNQGDNPTWHPKRWYDAPRSINLFLTQWCNSCVGCMVTTLANKPRNGSTDPRMMGERKRCAECGKDEAQSYCTLCHHYHHDRSKYLPVTEETRITIPTGKRTCDDRHVHVQIENTCFHMWHARGR